MAKYEYLVRQAYPSTAEHEDVISDLIVHLDTSSRLVEGAVSGIVPLSQIVADGWELVSVTSLPALEIDGLSDKVGKVVKLLAVFRRLV